MPVILSTPPQGDTRTLADGLQELAPHGRALTSSRPSPSRQAQNHRCELRFFVKALRFDAADGCHLGVVDVLFFAEVNNIVHVRVGQNFG